jgi:hypothetical protein
MQPDTIFFVGQIFWDIFLITLASVIVSTVISFVVVNTVPEEKIESFLNKYGV